MLKSVLQTLVAICCLLLAVEGLAWVFLPESDRRPFLFDPESGNPQGRLFALGIANPRLDPMLSWAPSLAAVNSADFLGGDYRVYGAKDPRAMRIVITGGSTSDSFAPFEGMWTKVFIRLLRAKGYCVTGFFGGVAGYNSAQEMTKILRDRHSLKPDLHITYSGVNEEPNAWNFMPTTYIVRALGALVDYRRNFFLPNAVIYLSRKLGTKPALEGVNLGLAQSSLPSERWHAHIRTMHALSKEFNYEFFAALQPMLGMGEYNPSPEETALMVESELEKKWGPFYREARQLVKKLSYAQDMTNIFRGQSGLYYDDCHVNEVGNRIVGEQMFQAVTKRYGSLLEKFRFQCE